MTLEKLRPGQIEYLKENLTKLQEKNTEQEKLEQLNQILTEERNTPINTINLAVTLIFTTLLIILFIAGQFNSTIIKVEIGCDGKPTNPNQTLILNPQGKVIDVLQNNQSLTNKEYNTKTQT